ncbi:FtsX-like permease family protein [Actinoallomurus sp. NBC_01490]|uniref:ABC transporter permease n=1 Tax=Actinoallomurus sp. NBC_01490 TaxID=2903557 RepID=UPI002E2FDC09|nr:FtsX-like permease family protein [Actinoallomurus sp. NBC_01490]
MTGGLGTIVRAGVGRRRVQTVVMCLTATLAVTASVLAAGLIVASEGPFDHAFNRKHGAHLSARFDSSQATSTQVSATARARQVTAAAGPYPLVSVKPAPVDTGGGLPPGIRLTDLTVVGRQPGGPVDDLTLTKGRWATKPGEIVMSAHNEPFVLGNTMRFPGVPGDPLFKVVGIARSAGETADAWVPWTTIPSLTASGGRPDYQMLYRFKKASTNAQLDADRTAVAALAPKKSLVGVQSWLKVRLAATRVSATFAPFIVAFGILGLVMSILVVGIVVGGAVAAGTRRIGILKSLGFTPGQVVRAYLGQALIPGGAGTLLGLVLGNLVAIPVMGDTAEVYGVGRAGIAPWVDVLVAAVALLTIAAGAWAPARRAGNLRTVEAIAVGRTPSGDRGRVARRVLGRLPLPRPLTLGLATPFARPGRSATMAVAVAIGTIGATFGIGLALSLNGVQSGINLRSPGDVVVSDLTSPVNTDKVDAAISRQPGTRQWFNSAEADLGVAGLAGSTTVISYQGDSSWASWQMIRGRWFHGAGEVVAASGFLHATGTRIGDGITLINGSRSSTVKIVGEVLDVRQEGMLIVLDRTSIAALHPQMDPLSYRFNVRLKPGVNRDDYIQAVNRDLEPFGVSATRNGNKLSDTVVSMDALAGALTVLLLSVAGLGVLNTAVLDTRERVHDLGVLKALGMSPRQTTAMIITSVSGVGLIAGVVGVPIGVAVHGIVIPIMGRAAGTDIPAVDVAVYDLPLVIPLLLGGLVIATAGALLPAGWATRTRTAVALRTE